MEQTKTMARDQRKQNETSEKEIDKKILDINFIRDRSFDRK